MKARDEVGCARKIVKKGPGVAPGCRTKADLKLAVAISVADAKGACAGTTAEIDALVDQCVAALPSAAPQPIMCDGGSEFPTCGGTCASGMRCQPVQAFLDGFTVFAGCLCVHPTNRLCEASPGDCNLARMAFSYCEDPSHACLVTLDGVLDEKNPTCSEAHCGVAVPTTTSTSPATTTTTSTTTSTSSTSTSTSTSTEGCGTTCPSGEECYVERGGIAITTIFDWVNQLNAENFAGHSDWRVPTEAGFNSSGTRELASILQQPCVGTPCIDPIFGPTIGTGYWSRTSNEMRFVEGWFLNFFDGGVGNLLKREALFTRAVRGGP